MRRRRAERREPEADLQYNNKVVGELINMVMLKGKKSVAEGIVYKALETVKKHTATENAISIVDKAVENVRPLLEVKSRRVGGATYQIPIEVKSGRGTTLALRWIRDYARARKGKAMAEKLADELTDAFHGQGVTIKRREDTHKMAEANRAFAHYRW